MGNGWAALGGVGKRKKTKKTKTLRILEEAATEEGFRREEFLGSWGIRWGVACETREFCVAGFIANGQEAVEGRQLDW